MSADNHNEAFIKLENVTVDFPVYGSHARSMKLRLMDITTGGRIGTEKSDRITIRALSNLSFELNAGDRLGILGHNGAGKTTLLRVIASVYEPTAGRMIIAGKTGGLYDLTLGMDPEATGFENIMLRGMLLGLSKERIKDITPEIVEFTELGNYLALPIRTYSSGMLLRLGYAVTTAVDLDIVVMDEWVVVGDKNFKHKSEARLEQLLDRSKIMVVATHSPELVERVCNKAILLMHGECVCMGEPSEVVRQYLASS
jgi:lipopolysaccharide transport system ATP-binding protein